MNNYFLLKYYLQNPPLKYIFFSWSEAIAKVLELNANIQKNKIEVFFISKEIEELVIVLNEKDC